MEVSARQLAFAAELFADLGQVSVRKMFGGAGVYAGGVMFALIDDDVIYLKADEALKGDLAGEGSRPWIYTPAKGPRAGVSIQTGYWSMPETALDDPEAACAWARRALAVAAAKPRKPRR